MHSIVLFGILRRFRPDQSVRANQKSNCIDCVSCNSGSSGAMLCRVNRAMREGQTLIGGLLKAAKLCATILLDGWLKTPIESLARSEFTSKALRRCPREENIVRHGALKRQGIPRCANTASLVSNRLPTGPDCNSILPTESHGPPANDLVFHR